ncbi:hypothetical protein O1611_g2002 [Lasiodiplodia mahajangana]|uniref:Uncharacterized protein n=1 Tax=Lasiodiplodia mahajangana TaxID=1108764 RepID=A0ACC2JW34_9PEZI|nr:hypothetical protein O1611_g2002 [Lasiodiplodia mahajangana]
MTRTQHHVEKTRIIRGLIDEASTIAMAGSMSEAQNTYKQVKRERAELDQMLEQKEEELRRKENNWDQERGRFNRELERSHENMARSTRERGLYQRGKAQWLGKTDEFNLWMRDRQSSILLADQATTSQVLAVSPMSSFCATLSSALADGNSKNITLSFIAGMHVGTDSPSRSLDGPQGMMRNLIVQLYMASAVFEPNLEFLGPDSLQAYQQGDLKALCELFVRLVEQIPSGINVFCIIDGISWYEQPPWLTGLRRVIGMFEYLMTRLDPEETAILKVLMTSHGRSTDVVRRTREGEYSRFWQHVTLTAGHIFLPRPQNRSREV